MSKYQVIVGNIGTVYDGDNPVEARRLFGVYREQSKTEVGRAGGEDVVLMEESGPLLEFFGSQSGLEQLQALPAITFEELKKAFLEVLDGNSESYEIQEQTGLSKERCEEISRMYKRLSVQY